MSGSSEHDLERTEHLVRLPDGNYPSTRYSGSKRRMLTNIFQVLKGIEFTTALDVFGGTGVVSYLMKRMDKQVTFNDHLRANYWSAVGLIENGSVRITDEDRSLLLKSVSAPGPEEPGFIEKTFEGVYFTSEENRWLDNMIVAIENLLDMYDPCVARFKKALALYAVFQSSLRKRPFNMFHRANLQLRLREVHRSFGNLTTWNTPFSQHFNHFLDEANNLVFDNGKANLVFCEDARDWVPPNTVDLVYIDPPYVSTPPQWHTVDYAPKYHFLEGLVRYEEWPTLINTDSLRKEIRDGYRPWATEEERLAGAPLTTLGQIFERYQASIIVVSYRDPGFPSIEALSAALRNIKPRVQVFRWPHRYALAKQIQGEQLIAHEVLLVGSDN